MLPLQAGCTVFIGKFLPHYVFVIREKLYPVLADRPFDVCDPVRFSAYEVLRGEPLHGRGRQKLQLVLVPRGLHARALQVFPGDREIRSER